MLVAQKEKKLKMKQVAVSGNMQRSGIGRQLLLAAEKFAIENNYNYLFCHARASAVSFYKTSGYDIKGDVFYEVNIPHYYMYKKLK